MAAQYPIDDERQGPRIVHVDPPYDDDDDYYYDRESSPERLDSRMHRTAEYVSGLNPNGDSYPPDNHSHHHHHHHHNYNPHGLPPLTIRRHTPGSNDPSLQKFPINLQSSSENISSSSNVNVTIKRNPISSDLPIVQPVVQPVIQPVLYPVAVYVNSPVPQPPIPQYPVPQYPVPQYSIPQYPILQYPVPQPIEQNLPTKEIIKPKSPVKNSLSPLPPPSISPTRYEVESFRPPASRNKDTNTPNRRPIRLDHVQPSPPILEPRKVRSGQMVVEEFDNYDEYYRTPTVYSVPKKVVSYRTVPGKTTRELENEQMDQSEKPTYVESPRVKTITYRVS